VLIEQAIFTSAKTDRAQGYQLLSRSPHLSESDGRELSLWGPSHESLLDQPGEPTSLNFFPLASGAYCVSKTTVAGAEYSGRGGEQVYTQFLVVPQEAMARFANNPFAILRAAAASGALCVESPVPEILPAIQLGGRAPVVDLGLLAQLARDPGPQVMAAWVQAALSQPRLAVSSEIPCEQLVAGLFNLLPVECRLEFSFATGLIHSPRRPVRILALPADPALARQLARQDIAILRLDGSQCDVGFDGWAAWVASVLSSGKLSALAAELEQPRPGLTTAGLAELSATLQRRTDTVKHSTTPRVSARPKPASSKSETTSTVDRADPAHLVQPSGVLLDDPARNAAQLDQLAERLAHQPAEVLELLERIDDLVFSAISGDARALAELEVLWPLAEMDLDPDLVEQSREQYLRCALAICSDQAESEAPRPERALAAIDVLSVLFEE